MAHHMTSHSPDPVSDTPDELKTRIAQLARTASLEISVKDIPHLTDVQSLIPEGATIAIPWLPKDTHDDRVSAARAVRDAGFEPLPHIAARRIADGNEAERLLSRLREEAGASRLFFIGGDADQPAGHISSALDLLSQSRPGWQAYQQVGFAAYPEPHPLIDRQTLQDALDRKIALAQVAGVEAFAVTQFAFSARPILDWLPAFRERHSIPVRIGLAGPATVRTLFRYARICGIESSARAVVSNATSIARLLREAGPDPVIRGLAHANPQSSFGPVSLHLFPFGGMLRTARWLAAVANGDFTLRPGASGFELNA